MITRPVDNEDYPMCPHCFKEITSIENLNFKHRSSLVMCPQCNESFVCEKRTTVTYVSTIPESATA